MDDENPLKDADDLMALRESVAEENVDEQMRPAGESGRASEAKAEKKRVDEDVEGDEPEPPVEADTGAQS